jgi:uncharacterized protein YbjT (DUF2867 family)
MSENFGVFPASGGLGGSTLNHLLDVVDPSQVTLIVRKPQNALLKAKESSATIRAADYDNASTLSNVFNGISVLNLISYASIEHEHRFKVSFYKTYWRLMKMIVKLTDPAYKGT